MTSRERVERAFQHREADRIPLQDSIWNSTLLRWKEEGLPDTPLEKYFSWEMAWFGGDETLQLPSETLEETEEYRITQGGDGAVVKNWVNSTSTPEMIDFTVKTRADWEALRPRMTWNDTRVDWGRQLENYRVAREQDLFCYVGFYTGFTRTCDMCGTDTVLMAMLDDPAWISEMLMARSLLCLEMAEEMLAHGIDIDAVWVFDDLGFKGRSFFSTALYRELVMPSHALICDFFRAIGKHTILHSCGYVMELAPLLIETGYECLQPLEVKAGNDLLAMKRQYGEKLTLMGGIDVRAMADPDPAAIEREIAAKIPAAREGGGYIYHSDHSIPDNVSFAQYSRVLELVREYGKF